MTAIDLKRWTKPILSQFTFKNCRCWIHLLHAGSVDDHRTLDLFVALQPAGKGSDVSQWVRGVARDAVFRPQVSRVLQ